MEPFWVFSQNTRSLQQIHHVDDNQTEFQEILNQIRCENPTSTLSDTPIDFLIKHHLEFNINYTTQERAAIKQEVIFIWAKK